MKHEIVSAESEELLREVGIDIPLAKMVAFILEYADTGIVDPDELQDLAAEIRDVLEAVSK